MKTRRRPPGGSAWCLYARLVTQPTFWRKVKQLVNSLSQLFYFYPFYLVNCSDISWHLLVCNISGKWCQPNGLFLFPIIWYRDISWNIFERESTWGWVLHRASDHFWCCRGHVTLFAPENRHVESKCWGWNHWKPTCVRLANCRGNWTLHNFPVVIRLGNGFPNFAQQASFVF
jgi:hypothetical protein